MAAGCCSRSSCHTRCAASSSCIMISVTRPSFPTPPCTRRSSASSTSIATHPPPPPYRWTWSTASVLGHCNGLMLYEDMRGLHVANPATQRRALLPPPPPFGRRWWGFEHLVFDPAESPDFMVFLVPKGPTDEEEISLELRQQAMDEPSVEWPASTWVLCVFSSSTGQWEERAFVREGEAAGMASDEVLRKGSVFFPRCSAYWRGVFYVQCNDGLTVMRLRVWILDDSCGKIEWVLKHHIDIRHSVSCVKMFCEENEGPWKFQDANKISEDYGQQNLQDNIDGDDRNNALVKSEVEWDSDSDNIVDNDIVQEFTGYIGILGFHPYKDVIFLDLELDRAVAYHLNTSMVQDLGKICPDGYCGHAAAITSSFVYTPCLVAKFPENKSEPMLEAS